MKRKGETRVYLVDLEEWTFVQKRESIEEKEIFENREESERNSNREHWDSIQWNRFRENSNNSMKIDSAIDGFERCRSNAKEEEEDERSARWKKRGEGTNTNDLFIQLSSLLNFIHLGEISEGILLIKVLQDRGLFFFNGDQNRIS